MLDDNLRAELDQASAGLSEMLPPLWRGIYMNLQEQDFTPEESMDLLKTYIIGQNPHGTNG